MHRGRFRFPCSRSSVQSPESEDQQPSSSRGGVATKAGSWLLALITLLYGPPSENYSLALMPSIGSGSRKVSILARDSTLGLWIQGMCLRPGLSLFVKSLEVGLELRSIYAPNPTAAKLDSRKVPRSIHA